MEIGVKLPAIPFKVVMVDSIARNITATEETEELAKINAELVKINCSNEDEIIEATRDADAIITRFAKITRRVIETVPKCKVIVRYGIGYDNIDVDAATDNNIPVVNTPDFCLEEVSNHIIMLILACAKRLLLFSNFTKQGRWHEWRRVQLPMVSIYGQTLGLIGCGHIARMVAKKAQCFDLKTIGYDPYVDKSLTNVSPQRGATLYQTRYQTRHEHSANTTITNRCRTAIPNSPSLSGAQSDRSGSTVSRHVSGAL